MGNANHDKLSIMNIKQHQYTKTRHFFWETYFDNSHSKDVLKTSFISLEKDLIKTQHQTFFVLFIRNNEPQQVFVMPSSFTLTI